MKNGKHVNLGVMCPCYKDNNRMSIYCLGVSEASSVATTFNNPAERKRYMKKHCCPVENSRRCVLYAILFKENMNHEK